MEKKIETGVARQKGQAWTIFADSTIDGKQANVEGIPATLFMSPLEARLLASLLIVHAEQAESLNSGDAPSNERLRETFRLIRGEG